MRMLAAGSAAAPAYDTIEPIGRRALVRLPQQPRGMVVFAHPCGDARRSLRCLHLAAALHEERIGTMIFDLLSEEEAKHPGNVFDIDLMAARLVIATSWLRLRLGRRELPIGYFADSTGTAAALVADAIGGEDTAAVVSRGGRPELVGLQLADVRAPTLLIVGEQDPDMVTCNKQAVAALGCGSKLAIVPDASNLFDEGDALDVVADLACHWFVDHFARFAASMRPPLRMIARAYSPAAPAPVDRRSVALLKCHAAE